jgi:hypothetical protein
MGIRHGHTAWARTRSMDMNMQHGLRHETWTMTCSIGLILDIQHLLVYVRVHNACSHPCCMSMSILLHVHAAWPGPSYMSRSYWISMSMLYLHHISMLHACSCPYCVYLTMLHIHVYAVFISYFHAACMTKCMLHAKSNCLSISMLHVYIHTAGQVYAARPIHPACPCQCCMSMPMLHVHVHALCLRSCCMPN